MANVLFSRTDSPSTKPITDGQIIFDTSGNGKMYLDNGTTRLEMGGAIDVDTTLDATSTNPIQNKGVAGVMLSELEEVRGTTKKGFLTDALATKTLDAKIGTTDISSIGDGTVTGAISDVNGKLSNLENDFDLSLANCTSWGNTDNTITKIGNRVFITFGVQLTVEQSSGLLIIGKIAKAYYPKTTYVRTNAVDNEGGNHMLYIDKSNGAIKLYVSTERYYSASFSYIAD